VFVITEFDCICFEEDDRDENMENTDSLPFTQTINPNYPVNVVTITIHFFFMFVLSGADAIKKFTPTLGIPYLGVRSKIWEPLVTPKSGLLNF